MTRDDFRLLFTALGFLAVAMKGKKADGDKAKQVHAMAGLIEAFCRTAHPDMFLGEADEGAAELDAVIESLKEDKLLFGQMTGLMADRERLYRVYARLLQRFRAYAPDDMIADEVMHLLEEEILFEAGGTRIGRSA